MLDHRLLTSLGTHRMGSRGRRVLRGEGCLALLCGGGFGRIKVPAPRLLSTLFWEGINRRFFRGESLVLSNVEDFSFSLEDMAHRGVWGIGSRTGSSKGAQGHCGIHPCLRFPEFKEERCLAEEAQFLHCWQNDWGRKWQEAEPTETQDRALENPSTCTRLGWRMSTYHVFIPSFAN